MKALAAESGVELLAPRARRVAFRLYALYDWALDKWDPRGPVGFGSMDQWHLGVGFAQR